MGFCWVTSLLYLNWVLEIHYFFPFSCFMLRTNIQVEEFLANSAQISTVRHSSVKLNKQIRHSSFYHVLKNPILK